MIAHIRRVSSRTLEAQSARGQEDQAEHLGHSRPVGCNRVLAADCAHKIALGDRETVQHCAESLEALRDLNAAETLEALGARVLAAAHAQHREVCVELLQHVLQQLLIRSLELHLSARHGWGGARAQVKSAQRQAQQRAQTIDAEPQSDGSLQAQGQTQAQALALSQVETLSLMARSSRRPGSAGPQQLLATVGTLRSARSRACSLAIQAQVQAQA